MKQARKTISKIELQAKLSPEQYSITQEAATEAPFSGEYWDHHEKGTYVCVACDQPLFDSNDKFDSGTGWPSFTCPVESNAVGQELDWSHWMMRTEVHCEECGAHLGHVFSDGPDGQQRYCINSGSLKFVPNKED